MSQLTEAEIAREARRIFRKLDAPGAHLRPDGEETWRVASRAEAASGIKVAAALVDAFARRGWIARAGARQTYVLSDVGLGWFRRAQAEADPFAAQHQLRRQALVKDERGIERRVTVDDAESPLARLRQRGLIDRTQFAAGEKLRVDFTLAGLSPRLGVDLAAPVLARTRGKLARHLISDTVVAAKQRFTAAMLAAGPGLADLLFDVCCHLRGLEDAERAKGWPGRSGRVVLGIALDRLADHYGLHLRGTAKLRGWQMEEGDDERILPSP
jgi:hypothetical protein